jgi:outer membrane protein insertion porin family
MRLVEGAPFNTEALKYSVRRLNQLGYFQNLEGNQNDIQVEKTPNEKNQVDVTLKLKEQNRNQLTFGAGVSQFEGFFGQLSFQTSNFLGRGESLTLSAQAGSRAEQYQVAFSEPFLFDRNITGGIDIYRRSIQYISQFTQKSTGGNILFGFPVADFSRLYTTYSYEQVRVSDLNEFMFNPNCIFTDVGCRDISLDNLDEMDQDIREALQGNVFLQDSLLVGQQGRRTVSKITPSFVFNTVDNPIFPNTGRRLTLSFDFAGIGGNTNFIKPRAEAIAFFRHTGRTSVGFRGQVEYIRPYGSTDILPVFERLFLGGEYSVRGFDIRSIGPRDEGTGIVVGGNKSLLFNAEYLITIAQPVRLVLFYDAGQALNNGDNFSLNEFKTSTGAEVRFFMPVLNVPFRLIFAYNPQRENVLDNNFNDAKKFAFRFAVGSTF